MTYGRYVTVQRSPYYSLIMSLLCAAKVLLAKMRHAVLST